MRAAGKMCALCTRSPAWLTRTWSGLDALHATSSSRSNHLTFGSRRTLAACAPLEALITFQASPRLCCRMRRRPHIWKPWHTEPSPAERAVVQTPEDIAEIAANRAQRRREIKKRGNAAFRARRKAQRKAEDGDG
jgi:hypothetical protein